MVQSVTIVDAVPQASGTIIVGFIEIEDEGLLARLKTTRRLRKKW
jgi:hypothetical protein